MNIELTPKQVQYVSYALGKMTDEKSEEGGFEPGFGFEVYDLFANLVEDLDK